MKKLFVTLSALLVFLLSFSFVGCDDNKWILVKSFSCGDSSYITRGTILVSDSEETTKEKYDEFIAKRQEETDKEIEEREEAKNTLPEAELFFGDAEKYIKLKTNEIKGTEYYYEVEQNGSVTGYKYYTYTEYVLSESVEICIIDDTTVDVRYRTSASNGFGSFYQYRFVNQSYSFSYLTV